jgi:hypothetical protein
MDTVAPIDTSSIHYHFVSESLSAKYSLIDDGSQALRGTRDHFEPRAGLGLIDVSGSIVFHPTPDDLDTLLPKILGGAKSTFDFPTAETVPSFLVAIDRVAKVHTYSGCYVDKAIFSGTKGGNIKLELKIIGTSEAEGAAASFPALTASVMKPYQFNQGALKLANTTHIYNQFVLVIDNHLEREFNNSPTATDIVAADRTVAHRGRASPPTR